MVLATLWDLPISEHLYNPTNGFAIMMEVMGWWPFLFPPLMLSWYYITLPKAGEEISRRKIFGIILCLIFTFSLFWCGFIFMLIRDWTTGVVDIHTYLWLAAVLLLVMLTGLLVSKTPAHKRRVIWFVGWAGTVLAGVNLVVITALKLIWQRTRFDTLVLEGSYADFTSWFQPFANGGDSFPSGHVADAVSLLLLISLCDAWPKAEKHKALMYAIAWVYIAFMAYTRIVLGSHYLSDVLVGAALIALLYFIMRRQAWYARILTWVRE